MKKRKKGVSPIVSTVLLIMIVVILAIIILLWSKGFIQEAILKEIGGTKKNVEQWCGDVEINPIIDETSGDFGFMNKGNVPIKAFKIKTKSADSGSTNINKEVTSINPGFSIIVTGYNYNDYEEVEVIPILLGKTKRGDTEEFECPEKYSLPL